MPRTPNQARTVQPKGNNASARRVADRTARTEPPGAADAGETEDARPGEHQNPKKTRTAREKTGHNTRPRAPRPTRRRAREQAGAQRRRSQTTKKKRGREASSRSSEKTSHTQGNRPHMTHLSQTQNHISKQSGCSRRVPQLPLSTSQTYTPHRPDGPLDRARKRNPSNPGAFLSRQTQSSAAT